MRKKYKGTDIELTFPCTMGKHVFCICGKEMKSLGVDKDKKNEVFKCCSCGYSISIPWEWGVV